MEWLLFFEFVAMLLLIPICFVMVMAVITVGVGCWVYKHDSHDK